MAKQLKDNPRSLSPYNTRKRAPTTNVHNLTKSWPIFKICSLADSLVNRAYATKSSLTIPPHLKRVAALHCETSISEYYRKFDACIVINDKSQGSVATRLRCGGLFSNCFSTDSLLSLLVKQFLKSVNIWRSYGQYYSGLLWSPYGIGQTIIFLPCDFYLSFFLLLFLA